MRLNYLLVIVCLLTVSRSAKAQDYELVHHRVIPGQAYELFAKSDGTGYILKHWMPQSSDVVNVGIWDEHLIEGGNGLLSYLFYSEDFTYQYGVFHGGHMSSNVGGSTSNQLVVNVNPWPTQFSNWDEFISQPPVENYPSTTFGQHIFLKYDVAGQTCEGILDVEAPFVDVGQSLQGPFPGFFPAVNAQTITSDNSQFSVVLGDSLLVAYGTLFGEQSVNDEVSFTPPGGQINLLRLSANLNTNAYEAQQIGSESGSQMVIYVGTDTAMNEIYRMGIVRGNDTPVSISGAEVNMSAGDSLYYVYVTKESIDGQTEWVTELFAYNNLNPDSIPVTPYGAFRVDLIKNSVTKRNDLLFVNSSIVAVAAEGDSILYRDFEGQENMFADYLPWVVDNSPRQYAFAESRIFKLDLNGEISGKLATVFPKGHYVSESFPQSTKLIEVGDRLAWLQKYQSDTDTTASIVYSGMDGSQQTSEIPLPAGKGYVIIWLDDLLTVVDHWIIPVETDAPLQGGFRINSILPYQGDTLVIQGVMTNYVTTDLNPFDDTETVSIEDNVGSFFAFYSVPGFFTNTEPASNGVSFAIYPNPASESITVRGEKLDRAEYSIYDLRGRLLKRGQRASDGLIDVSDLTGGVYLINLRTGEGSGTRRFVVW